MASDADALRTIRTDTIAELGRWLTAGPTGWANFKPNRNGTDALDYATHIRTLRETIADLNEQIATIESQDDPWELITEVDT